MSTLYIPAGSITNTEIAQNAAIGVDKVVHSVPARHLQATGADVATKTELVHIARAAGTLSAVKVVVATAPTGGDKAFTVDVKRSTGGGAFASVLTGVVTINSSSTALTVYNATITGTTYASGDVFQVVVAASGSTGSQGQGLIVELFFSEATS